MKKEYLFEDKHEFVKKFKELLKEGVPVDRMQIYLPFPVEEVEEILGRPVSKLNIITLLGAITGTITGFGFTIYTVLSWPLITGGKPLISIPAFVIIAFELTILFGAITSFLGFLSLSRLPDIRRILNPIEFDNRFTIVIDDGEDDGKGDED